MARGLITVVCGLLHYQFPLFQNTVHVCYLVKIHTRGERAFKVCVGCNQWLLQYLPSVHVQQLKYRAVLHIQHAYLKTSAGSGVGEYHYLIFRRYGCHSAGRLRQHI